MSSIRLSKLSRTDFKKDFILVSDKLLSLRTAGLSTAEQKHLREQLNEGVGSATTERNGQLIMVVIIKGRNSGALEKARKAGSGFATKLNGIGRKEVQVHGVDADREVALALVEGMLLGSYRFDGYKTKKKKEKVMSRIKVHHKELSSADLNEITGVAKSVMWARDLVNRPLSHLTAVDLAKEIKTMGKDAGFKVEVFNMTRIKSLKMGGLLAVNLGSPDPPTFSILEWKPKGAINKKPIVLVGKGVVYDTGGLSLKPTANSMDRMKCDMAGAACMAATVHAVASQKLPVHVIGLIPATDNRPGGNAYAPGDVITMHDGQTVEVLNTDAEGRMILADALSYSKRYKPELVFEASTLTGAAARAIGAHGVVAMGTAKDKVFADLDHAGMEVYERIARQPFWEEYDKDLESDIADMKNLGGAAAGHITAGKFLARFVEAPFVHLDIAGPAFITSANGYKPKGGTGVGVRLLYRYLRNLSGK